MSKLAVIGAGTWGIALARMLCLSGHEVRVWSALPEEIDELSSTRRHKNLPEMVIPSEIVFSKSLEAVCLGTDIIVMAVPSVYVRSTARSLATFVSGQIIVDVAKGIEPDTMLTMSEVISSEIPSVPVVALSGPTHAEEVARDLPTTIVSACASLPVAEKVQAVFTNSVMRVYTNTDIRGVELCGALKNIIALACGCLAGLGYGDNIKAAAITRGLTEMRRLGLAMGCVPETFSGLAGMGDLIVTATSVHSRNNKCGKLIGQGLSVSDAVSEVGMVVEGISALTAAVELSDKYDVHMPIIRAVDRVVNGGADPRATVVELMAMDGVSEFE